MIRKFKEGFRILAESGRNIRTFRFAQEPCFFASAKMWGLIRLANKRKKD